MDFAQLIKYAKVIFREVWKNKFLCLLGFAFFSFAVLGVGMLWSSKFEASATIFADNQNILKPLLEDQAAQAQVQNQTKVVKDMMHSPRILKQVVEQVYGLDSLSSAEELGQRITGIRSKLLVKGLGAGYIKVSYSDKTAQESYDVVNTVIDLFIRFNAEDQRSESREAFSFINNQVKQYKDQLVLAEEKLKQFRGQNLDGRSVDVDNTISRLRSQIEELKISIDEDRTKITALQKQLEDESEFSAKKFKADVFSEKLLQLEENMSTLLLSYTENHPDVVALKYQINDIKKAIKDAAEDKNKDSSDDEEAVTNPLYQELRSRLSIAQTDIKTKRKRLTSLEELLDKEYDRRKRIAERAAEEAELTRDYDVTRRIYEDMLERKEKARLSMTLNVEGQGVSYRVQEPALPPLNPVGLRYLHFVLLGPFVGLFGVLGIIAMFVMLDQRIRFPDSLLDLKVPVLAVVPHVSTPFTTRMVKIDMLLCVFLGCLIMAAYVGLAYAAKVGLI